MPTTVDFEGLTAPNVRVPTIPAGYAGFNWTNVGTVGIKYLNTHFNNDGFHHVIHQKIVGDALDLGNHAVHSVITDAQGVGHEGTFTLKSGTFAAAFNMNEVVTFSAYIGASLVGTKVVTMDQTAQTVTFPSTFKHITSVHIDSDGGTDENGSDGGTGYDIAMDNLKVVFDMAAAHHDAAAHPVPVHEFTPSAHEFGAMHGDGWALM